MKPYARITLLALATTLALAACDKAAPKPADGADKTAEAGKDAPAPGKAEPAPGKAPPAPGNAAEPAPSKLDEFLWGNKRRQGAVEAAAKSATRTVATGLGRQLLRGILGSLLGGKKR